MSRHGGIRRNSGGGDAAGLVRDRIEGDPAWQHYTRDGRWMCPYCLTAIRSPQPGKANMQRAIERHLANRCGGFAEGSGRYQIDTAISRAVQQEDIAHLALSDPAWQVFDQEGYWYSPASLQKVITVRIQNRRFDGFTVQRMAEHLTTCPHFKQGILHPVAAVQAARDQAVRVSKLTQSVRKMLTHTIWRYKNSFGHWVCPYCLDPVPHVHAREESDWFSCSENMARHLLQECRSFSPSQQQLQPEEKVRAVAGGYTPPAAPPPATVRIRSGTRMERRTALQHRSDQTRDAPPVATPRPTNTTPLPTAPPTAPPVAKPRPSPVPIDADDFEPAPIMHEDNDPSRTNPLGYAARIDPPTSMIIKMTEEDKTAHDSGDAEEPVITGTERIRREQTLSPSNPTVALETLNDLPDLPNAGDTAASIAANEAFDEVFAWMDAKDDEVEHTPTSSSEAKPDTDLIRAADVQKNMLRMAPELPGFSFATRFEAAGEVSGDFYEFIELKDGRIAIAQGDVSGHGMQAGLIMSMAKKVTHIYGSMGQSPAEVLSAVNEAIVDDLGGKMFVTMTYAILDPVNRRITWARAGHNPTIRYNKHSGEMEEINPNGMVVGMKGGAIFGKTLQEETVEVRSGDIFMVYTDGVTETMNRQGEEYEPERLKQLIRAHAGTFDLEHLCDRIMDSVRSFRGSVPADDDMTLLALEVE